MVFQLSFVSNYGMVEYFIEEKQQNIRKVYKSRCAAELQENFSLFSCVDFSLTTNLHFNSLGCSQSGEKITNKYLALHQSHKELLNHLVPLTFTLA